MGPQGPSTPKRRHPHASCGKAQSLARRRKRTRPDCARHGRAAPVVHVRAPQQLLKRGRGRHGLAGDGASRAREIGVLAHAHGGQPLLLLGDARLRAAEPRRAPAGALGRQPVPPWWGGLRGPAHAHRAHSSPWPGDAGPSRPPQHHTHVHRRRCSQCGTAGRQQAVTPVPRHAASGGESAAQRACLAAKSAQRRSSTRPSSRPSGVSRRSALSLRSSRRNSERDVSMRYGSSRFCARRAPQPPADGEGARMEPQRRGPQYGAKTVRKETHGTCKGSRIRHPPYCEWMGLLESRKHAVASMLRTARLPGAATCGRAWRGAPPARTFVTRSSMRVPM